MRTHPLSAFFFFFFNDTATTEIYTLSLHDALPISRLGGAPGQRHRALLGPRQGGAAAGLLDADHFGLGVDHGGHVLPAALDGDAVERLHRLAVALDDQLEAVVAGSLAAGVGDLDGDVVALGAAVQRAHAVAAEAGLGAGGQLLLAVALGAVLADPDHVAVA